MRRLQAAIADRQVRAPFSGVLGLRRVSVGAYVQPATVITTLDDLAVVKLDFTIPETWLASVRRGMKVRARSDALPDAEFTGTVSMIATRLDPTTRSATVRARIERLQRSGEIVGFTVVLKGDAARDPVRGLMMLAIEGRGTDRILRQLGGLPQVRALHSTNGRWDLIVEIGTDTLLRWYVLHVLMLPFVIVIFMAIHFWRVRKDGGISGPL